MTDELSLARANELLRLARDELTWCAVEHLADRPQSYVRSIVDSIDRHLRLTDAGGN